MRTQCEAECRESALRSLPLFVRSAAALRGGGRTVKLAKRGGDEWRVIIIFICSCCLQIKQITRKIKAQMMYLYCCLKLSMRERERETFSANKLLFFTRV